MSTARRAEPLPLGGEDGLPFSKGRLARALMDAGVPTMRAYEQPDNWAKVQGGWIDSTASWNLHFLEEFTPALEEAEAKLAEMGLGKVTL